jgi:hypothetical protein
MFREPLQPVGKAGLPAGVEPMLAFGAALHLEAVTMLPSLEALVQLPVHLAEPVPAARLLHWKLACPRGDWETSGSAWIQGTTVPTVPLHCAQSPPCQPCFVANLAVVLAEQLLGLFEPLAAADGLFGLLA